MNIYETTKIKEVTSRDGEVFSLFMGLDQDLVSQLIKYSNDKLDVDIQNNTSDNKRFANIVAYENWFKKDRTPFVLVNKNTKDLASIVWFGPKKMRDDKNNWQAVGWRSYKPYRGKGLMKDFVLFCMDYYKENQKDSVFWAVLKRNNTGSFNLAQATGFSVLEEECDQDSIVMLK